MILMSVETAGRKNVGWVCLSFLMRDIKSDVLLWPLDCGALFYFILFYFV